MRAVNRFQLADGEVFLPDKRIVRRNILIDGETIKEVYFGSKKYEDVETTSIEGKMVVPGFIDSHTHLLQKGIAMMRPSLASAVSPEDALEILRQSLNNYENGQVVIVSDFDESGWQNKKIPEKKVLDRIAPANPLVIRRICGHLAVANTLALEKIPGKWGGVDRKTGVMKEDVPLNMSKIFPASRREMTEGFKGAVKLANSLGVTSVNEIAESEHLDYYEQLGNTGKMTLNVRLYISAPDISYVAKPRFDFRETIFGGIKIFADGSIGARTAANTFFYKDSPRNKGIVILTKDEISSVLRKANEAGMQLIIHAIGNRAIKGIIDVFENRISNGNPLRHRIEHCELVDEEDISRLVELGVVLSMQPNFIYRWSEAGGMYEKALGERYRLNNPIAILVKAGITVAFGSDCMPLSPLIGIEGTTQAPFDCQRLGLEDSIYCYTHNSAYAGFSLGTEGEIKTGKEANLVVLDRALKSIFSVYYKGRCVFSA